MKNKSNSNKKIVPQINTTSLPDIIFMLLFFFMVVTVIKSNDDQDQINVPSVTFGEKESDNSNTITLSIQYISEDNINYGLNNVAVGTFENLRTHLAKAQTSSNEWQEKQIKIKVDKHVSMQYVNQLKTLLRDHDMRHIEYIIRER